MRIAFFSNYLNHHQLPFCEAMYRELGTDFEFIATKQMPEMRRKLGYQQIGEKPYYLLTEQSEEAKNRALIIAKEYDAVIYGNCPNEYISIRPKNKLTLIYSERLFKKGFIRAMNPITISKLLPYTLDNGNAYLLCASAYACYDYNRIFAYRNRTFKWGYFPASAPVTMGELQLRKGKATVQILWAGRFIDWKHPDDMVTVAVRLQKDRLPFQLKMIGTGEMEDELRNEVEKNGLSDKVRFLGSMPPAQVREHMNEADVFVATSDFQEGWGVVLNEAMDSGCAVVASHAMGAAPYLIKNGVNGLMYLSGDVDMLYHKVKYLITHRAEMKKISEAAYQTIKEIWNVQAATKRLLELIGGLSGDKTVPYYSEGPCSKAEILKNNWLKGEKT